MASQEVSPPNIGAIDEVAPVLAALPQIRCETPEPKVPEADVSSHESPSPAPSFVCEVPEQPQVSKSTLNLALDLVLNEIALQARMTTTATGAMIGLSRSGVLECAAMTGASAPEVAACLNLRPGIAADCFHSGTVGRADDIAADTQADMVAYRRSGLRSILVVPVADEQGLALGILQIFSPRANAFCDRDVLTLEALARRIAANVELVLKNATASTIEVKTARPLPMTPDNGKSELQKSGSRVRASRRRSFSPRTKLRVGVLPIVRKAALVVFCLLVVCGAGRLAWMQARDKHLFSADPASGEGNRSSQPQTPKPVSSISPDQVEAAIDVYVRPETVAANVSRSRVPRANAVSSIAIDRKPISKTVSADGDHTKSRDNAPSLNEEASLPDHSPTSGKSAHQAAESHDSSASLLPTPSANSTVGSSGVEVVPTEAAMRMLVQRVEPEYPNVARRQHIQGTVMLDVMINAEGGVDAVTPISGESQLTSAAITAVQQWRFQPLLKSGKPKSFKSRIAIDFTLASSAPQGL